MDFLKNSYDKIILGLLLLVLAWQLLGFVQGVDKFNNEVEKKNIKKSFQENLEANKFIPLDEAKEFYLNGEVEKSLTDLYSVNSDDNSWTIDEYFNCTNLDCKKLLKYTAEADFKCPVCGKLEPQAAGYINQADDEDKDGIPATIENKYAFLDDSDANDAKLDHDGDGFPNIIEFITKTAMDDAKSHPPLVKLLRYTDVKIPTVGLKVGEINADDENLQASSFAIKIKRKKGWKTRFDISLNKRFRTRSGYFKVVKVIKVPPVSEFAPSTYSLDLVKVSVVKGKETELSHFIVPANSKDIKSKSRVIHFKYLVSQDDEDAGFSVMLNKTFKLSVKKEGAVVSEETYRVDSLTDEKVNVSFLKDEKVVSKHTVGKFNEELDTEYLKQRREAEEESAKKAEKTPAE